jgi:hypothetical protein
MVKSMDSSLKETANPASQPAEADLRHEAGQGNAAAQYGLGTRRYRASLEVNGMNRSECRIEAYKWLHLAATQGYQNALTICQGVILAMSRVEFDEGNRRVAAFVVQMPAEPHLP